MKKIALVLLGLAVFVIGTSFILKAGDRPDLPPATKEAQYSVRADDRYYYTNSYEIKMDKIYGQYLLLHGFWDTANGKEWIYHPVDLKLSYRAYSKPPTIMPRPTVLP